MKTPMQEVYDNFNLLSDADFKLWMLKTDLLKKEKEVIILTHINGQSEFDKGARRNINDKYAEQYFNQTFIDNLKTKTL